MSYPAGTAERLRQLAAALREWAEAEEACLRKHLNSLQDPRLPVYAERFTKVAVGDPLGEDHRRLIVAACDLREPPSNLAMDLAPLLLRLPVEFPFKEPVSAGFVECARRMRIRRNSGDLPRTSLYQFFFYMHSEKLHGIRAFAGKPWPLNRADVVRLVAEDLDGWADAVSPAEEALPLPVELFGEGRPCKVLGKEKPALTDGQYAVVKALLGAGENGLSKESLDEIRASAIRLLRNLRKDKDWAAVIRMAGKAWQRYRIVRPG